MSEKTAYQERDTLIYLYEGLNERDRFMCNLLESMGVGCDFLEKSGIEDEWLRRGYRAGYTYQLRFGFVNGLDYRKELIAEKKSVIATVLKERHGVEITK